MYNKLEEQEYASMLHCLRRESYRNTRQAEEEAVLEQGLPPLEVELPAKAPVTETQMAAGVGKRMDIRAFYSLKINHFLLLNGSIMTAYNHVYS